MRAPRRLVASVFFLFCIAPTVAFAQTRLAAPSVQLVSPGGPGSPTLTAACPTFSWAPGNGVAEYELAVFALDASNQPVSSPILHVAVSGRATSWTPAATKCLTPGREFGWYMREISQQGDKPGTWTPALAFSVVDQGKGTQAGKADWDPQPGVPGSGGGNGPANPNDEIIDRLTRIEATLTTLANKPAVSKETCFEIGAELEVGLDGEVKLRGGADGEAGVWAFGNGIKANLKAAAEVKLGAGLKGNGAIKRAWCWDPLVQLRSAQPAPRALASATAVAISDDDFIAKLSALSDQLQLGEDRIGGIMDALPLFNTGTDGFSALGSSSPISTVAAVLPLPADVRAKLSNPGQVISDFTAQRNFCQRNDLPDAVAGLIQQFCQQSNNEPFQTLLHRVDGVVDGIKGATVGPLSALGVVKTTVNTINGTLNDVRDTVDAIACSFFCKQN